MREPGYDIIGKRAVVRRCEAAEHDDSDSCVCGLIGRLVTIGRRVQTPFVGLPTFHIEGTTKRVRESEVVVARREA